MKRLQRFHVWACSEDEDNAHTIPPEEIQKLHEWIDRWTRNFAPSLHTTLLIERVAGYWAEHDELGGWLPDESTSEHVYVRDLDTGEVWRVLAYVQVRIERDYGGETVEEWEIEGDTWVKPFIDLFSVPMFGFRPHLPFPSP